MTSPATLPHATPRPKSASKIQTRAFLNSLLPAPRLLTYLALGALLWILAALLPAFRLVALVYDVGLIVMALVDLMMSPRPDEIEIERTFEPKMNLGARNEVSIRVRNRAKMPIVLTVRDEVPTAFSVQTNAPPRLMQERLLPTLPRFTLEVAPNGEATTHYGLTPNRRGDFRFGALHARYATGLGLWLRQFSREASDHARVYPDVTGVRRYEMALRDGKMRDMGLHLLKMRGRGTEFESLRDYNNDDEFKSINWKASAKRGKLIATNYEIERDQTMLICLDCGRLMTSLAAIREEKVAKNEEGENLEEASPILLSKLDCAINATVLLSHVAASMGDSVGLLLFSDSVLGFLPPRKGRVQTGLIIEALYNIQPALVEADYQLATEYLLARKLRRALVVTFTDLIDPEASRELLQASATLRRHHNPLCVTINNRDVIEMAQAFPNNPPQLYEKAMAQRMLQQRGAALEALRGAGAGILDVEANQLSVSTVNRYLDLKSRGAL